MENLFSGLENLGFNNINIKDIYDVDKKEPQLPLPSTSTTLIYDITVTCPVCDHTFKEKAVKTSSYKIDSKDSDLFIRYSIINPYFYEVWICPSCGYSSIKVDFDKINQNQKELILKNISPKFRNKIYTTPYDVNIAIERYKLALINSVFMESKASRKAMVCLKLAWMYRLLNNDKPNKDETKFLEQALKGFENAYLTEYFPLYGMDKFLCMYLIGELNKKTGNYDEALSWLSSVIIGKNVKQNLKELARTERDAIKEELSLREEIKTSSLSGNISLELSDELSEIEPAKKKERTSSILQFFRRK